ncbi:MAG: indolepyruvate ferredoxin oxidoreductase family protein [Ilumatobacter sp.]|nr:indolepyruvate ferredoxin oxidoreductase family protein [Ilumatobacter sp.]
MTDTMLDDYELSDRYRRDDGIAFLTGIQALARIPVEQLRRDRIAGLHTAAFVSGYPGSPLGGFDLEVARAVKVVPELPIVHQPAVNEELGATAVMGSQLAQGRPDATYDGVVGVWYGKAPGLDRAGDALRHGVFAGSSSRGGAVVLVGDDPACKSSTMPSSSDASLVDFHMPILYPGTMAECLELGLHAVAMSRASGLWSAMKIVTPVADGSGTVNLPVLATDPIMPTVEIDGQQWESHPSAQFLGQRMVAVEREFREVRLPLAQQYGVVNKLNRISVDPPDAWIGLAATGFTYHELLDALRRLGFDGERAIADAGIRLLQLRMPVPFDAELVRQFARGLDEIVVVEEKNPTLEWLIKDALYNRGHHPRVLGKTHEDGRTLMQSWGQLDADAMLDGLRERLAVRLADRLAPPPPAVRERTLIPLTVNRTPFFCSGCPHNWGTKVPEGALVGAGTGCHGMTLLMDEDRVGESIGITAMGNEGAQWIGMEPFVEATHLFQNYGDGTFLHSAQLAVQYCVGAGKNITFKILYNGTVAMTGGQDSTSPLEIPQLVTILLAYGVSKVAITAEDVDRYRDISLPRGVEVHDRSELLAVQDDLRATPGVTVLIHDQYCAAELRRARKRGKLPTPGKRVVINHRICEGCGDCGDVSNCLSVQPIDTPLGRKTAIDQASCNFDYSCVKGDCPAFMIVEGDAETAAVRRPADLGPIPEPDLDHTREHVRIRMAGIGGTGVVTVAQILSIAAMLDGWEVKGLDQTGLSQKAGPVVSDVILNRPGTSSSNLVGDGQADLLLGFDELVAAADNTIKAAHADATVVVASSHRTPTGRMITHPDIAYPTDSIDHRLDEAGRPGANRFPDASALAAALTGDAAQANVFLLGVAVQDGHLPVALDAIARAIDLNGVAVDANLAAFDWGRRWAADPATVERTAMAGGGRAAIETVTVADVPPALATRVAAVGGDDELAALLTMLTGDLVGFQDERYAAEFLDGVEAAATAERRVVPSPADLTATVARSLHKLMAYKDEYEVARLLLSPEAEHAAAEVAGPDATVTWQLHPPLLKALGMKSKIGLGSWSRPVFGALRLGKRVRGTRLDPFGRTELRRIERALPAEFRQSMDTVYSLLRPDNLDDAVAIAGLPDTIRGYEDLKLRRVAEYRDAIGTALGLFAEL